MDSKTAITRITERLDTVHQERARRLADPALGARAVAVRQFQAARFRRTYADLLASAATARAAQFFLDELYGEQDFMDRDAQFRRIVPALVRLFSADVVATVDRLAELHALSEQLDTRMADELRPGEPLDEPRYGQAWRAVGEPTLRERQIALVGEVGASLTRYTTHPKLGQALRMMRLPARAAGLSALQAFLERGFETFGNLPDAPGFLRTIQERERRLAAQLFASD